LFYIIILDDYTGASFIYCYLRDIGNLGITGDHRLKDFIWASAYCRRKTL